MAPIKVALVGLSSNAITSWASQAHLPYLLSPTGSKHYTITALLNSSVPAATAARAHYNLTPSVAVYGDPAALAADPNVDLVVITTRVDTHCALALPAAKAGKALFVEWPLTHSSPTAAELIAAATASSVPTLVGLQGRVAAPILRIKALLASGALGTVLSSRVEASGNLTGRGTLPEGLAYFADRAVGGNPSNIALAHFLDAVHHTLGEFRSFNATAQIMRPEVTLLNGEGNAVRTIMSDVPDLLTFSGSLVGDANDGVPRPYAVAPGASLSVYYRTGPPPPRTRGFTWTIHGTEGELCVSASGAYIQSDAYDEPITLELLDFASGEVSDLEWGWEEWQAALPVRARNIGTLYERFAAGWVSGGKGTEWGTEYPTFADAGVRMREIDEIYAKSGV